jgi:glycerol-3-phosphate cytidylyltransferase
MFDVGLIAGSFDIIHPGYIMMFNDAKKVCKILVVALQDDPTIDRLNKNKPVQTWQERKMILESLRQVDEIIYYNTEFDLEKIIRNFKYDIRILGSDYRETDFLGKDLNKPVYFCDRTHNYSLTNLKKKIAESMKQ